METHQIHTENEAGTHGNVLQEIDANPTPPINGVSEPAKANEIPDGNGNIEPAEPEEDGIRYSENVVPVGADEDSEPDQEQRQEQSKSKSAPATSGVGVAEKKKKRKKKSKSKRGLVKSSMALRQYEANSGDGSAGKAHRV